MRPLIFVLFLLCSGTGFAQLPCAFGGVKGGYLWFQDKNLCHVYNKGSAFGELEANFSAVRSCSNALYVFGDVSYLRKTGRSIGLGDRTRLEVVPISIGLKYAFTPTRYDWVSLYGGAGPRYYLFRIRNSSDFVKRKVEQNAFGGVLKAGVLLFFPCNIYCDVFGEYGFSKLSFQHHDKEIERRDLHAGGWTLGLGVGYHY